jgi:hypothetical protein
MTMYRMILLLSIIASSNFVTASPVQEPSKTPYSKFDFLLPAGVELPVPYNEKAIYANAFVGGALLFLTGFNLFNKQYIFSALTGVGLGLFGKFIFDEIQKIEGSKKRKYVILESLGFATLGFAAIPSFAAIVLGLSNLCKKMGIERADKIVKKAHRKQIEKGFGLVNPFV